MKKNRCNIKLIELIAHARRRTFTFGEESGKSLSEISRLDTMVTVVDSKAFLADYTSRDDLQEPKLALSEEDDRSISNLLNDQIEFANVLLINKADAVSEEEMGGFMRKLNPDARVIECVNGNIDASLILNTGKFDIVAAQNNPGWLKEMRGEHTPETEEYGISSFVYRARRPFHPMRFAATVDRGLVGVLRSKGFLWISSRHNECHTFSIVGGTTTMGSSGPWIASHGTRKDILREHHMADYFDRVWRGEWVTAVRSWSLSASIWTASSSLRPSTSACLPTPRWKPAPTPGTPTNKRCWLHVRSNRVN